MKNAKKWNRRINKNIEEGRGSRWGESGGGWGGEGGGGER